MASITGSELREWEEYYQMEPWGIEQGYHQAGMIAALLYNINSKKSAVQKTSADFVPDFLAPFKELKVQSVEEMATAFQRIAAAFPKKG